MLFFSGDGCSSEHACNVDNFNTQPDVELERVLKGDMPTLLGLILTLEEPSRNRCFKSKVSVCIQELCRNTAHLVGKKRKSDSFASKVIESLVRICSSPIIIETFDKVEVRYLMTFTYNRATSSIELNIPSDFSTTYWRYRQIALDLRVSVMLEKQTTAKEIYDYLSTNRKESSFPLALLRDAISLKHMSTGNQNRAIRSGLQKLEKFGLIQFVLSESLVTGELTVKAALI